MMGGTTGAGDGKTVIGDGLESATVTESATADGDRHDLGVGLGQAEQERSRGSKQPQSATGTPPTSSALQLPASLQGLGEGQAIDGGQFSSNGDPRGGPADSDIPAL